MKRAKKLIALGVIFALLSVSTLILTKYEEKQEEIQNSDEVLLEIPTDTVESISWEFEEEGLSFQKGEAGWSYDEDENFPVSEEKMIDLLSHFEAFGVSFIIENVEDYSQYGLDAPEGVVNITTADQSYEIKIGNFSQMDEKRYIDIGDGNVYLVNEDPADYMHTELSSMILHDETPSFETVKEIQISGKEDYSIAYTEEISYSYSEADTYFTELELEGKSKPLDPEAVSTYLDTIEQLSLVNYATYDVTDEELASYGLDNPEWSVTVQYTYTDDEEKEVDASYTIHLGENIEERKAADEAEENEEEEIPAVTKYVRIGDSQIVYELDDYAYETLAAASYDDLRHKEVFWADSDLMTQIDITLEGEEHVLTSKADEEDEETRNWYYGEEKIELAGFRTALKALMATTFTQETTDQKEEISLTIHLNHEQFQTVDIQLYRYDGTYCLAVVDGVSVSFVERSYVMDLVETVQTIVLN